MTLLEVRLNSREIQSGQRESIDLGFSEFTDVTYELRNPSLTDIITNINFVTNLPEDAFSIIDIPLELEPDTTKKAVIRFNSDRLLQLADSVNGSEASGKAFASFSYRRRRKIVI